MLILYTLKPWCMREREGGGGGKREDVCVCERERLPPSVAQVTLHDCRQTDNVPIISLAS